MISGCAVYRAGVALPETDTPVQAELQRGPGRLAWVSLNDPADEECQRLAAVLHLPAEHAAWLTSGGSTFLHSSQGHSVLRVGVARYDRARDLVDIGSLTALVGPDLLVVITRHAPAELRDAQRRMEEEAGTIAAGAWPVVHRLVEMAAAGYSEVLVDLRGDVEALERQAFAGGPSPGNITQRIYLLKREAIDFRQAAAGMRDPVEDLATGVVASGVHPQAWQLVHDRLDRVVDRADGVNDLLSGILTAYQTDVALRQNEDMRRISAWVAIAAVPTLLAGVYGMNFEHMPELSSRYGYPVLLAVMGVICVSLYMVFRRKDWL